MTVVIIFQLDLYLIKLAKILKYHFCHCLPLLKLVKQHCLSLTKLAATPAYLVCQMQRSKIVPHLVLASTVALIGAYGADIALHFLGQGKNTIENQLVIWNGIRASLQRLNFSKNQHALVVTNLF